MLTTAQKAAFMSLLKKYQQQKASPAEVKFLESYYLYFDKEEKQSLRLRPEQVELLENRIYRNIDRILRSDERNPVPYKKPVAFLFQKIAASVIFIILSAASVYFIVNRSAKQANAKIQTPAGRFKNDLPPGSNNAILTLADGSNIGLDSAHNGNLAKQGAAKILKYTNGILAYKSPGESGQPASGEEIKYNTVTTPRGGQYQIILTDGSKVWLNAASSLRFPVSFTGRNRMVELTGEAYFEVAKQIRPAGKNEMQQIPFVVKVNGVSVKVLGTHFNINAYEDENKVTTTLLEGAVKVELDNSFTVLKPGNQSEVDRNGNMKFIASANTEEAVAWKNGMFQFQSADIETIMRQVARWYNVDVEYSKKIDEKFYMEIPRTTQASVLFKILETTGAVHFEIDGRKVKVLP